MADTGDDSLLDFSQVFRVLGFVLRSLKRHTRLAATVAAVVMAMAVSAAALAPRSYHVDTKILAQRNLIMSNLGNPRRSIPNEADAPTRSASETVLKRDNLVALIKQVNLLDEWRATRAPILLARDRIMELVTGQESEEDRLENLIGLLSKRIKVMAEEGTVTISIDWPDATLAYRIVSSAQQNFLEVRHAEEVSSIAETITILEGHASSIRENIEAAIGEMDRPSAQAAVNDPKAAQKLAARKAAGTVERERGQLRTMIFGKRKAIADLEDFRNRRVAELQAQLSEQLSVYADQHPMVQNTRATIASMSAESPQIKALRMQEKELIDEYNKKGGQQLPAGAEDLRAPELSVGNGDLGARPASPGRALTAEQLSYQQARVRVAMGSYEELSERIQAARIELDTTRAAFKYRYSIIIPPLVPKDPMSPNVKMIVLAGVFAALALAFATATLKDLASGKLLEPWQVSQRLKLPILAEVREK